VGFLISLLLCYSSFGNEEYLVLRLQPLNIFALAFLDSSFRRNDGVCFDGKGGNNGGSMGAAVVSAVLPTDCRHSERSGAE